MPTTATAIDSENQHPLSRDDRRVMELERLTAERQQHGRASSGTGFGW
jgi:hypothetical protein